MEEANTCVNTYHKMFRRETPKQPFYESCCNVKCCKHIGHPPKIAAGRFKEKAISFKTHVNFQIKYNADVLINFLFSKLCL